MRTFQPGLMGGKGEQGLAADTVCWSRHPCQGRWGGWIGDTGLGFLGALMGTAIFHSCAFFPPIPKLGSKCTDHKTDLGACGHARCRKQAHVAALALPSVLPHYPAPRAVPAAPAPAKARAWRRWLSASSLLPPPPPPASAPHKPPSRGVCSQEARVPTFVPLHTITSVYCPAGQREACAAAASGRAH